MVRRKDLTMLDNSTAIELGVSEFVLILNQTLNIAFPEVTIVGELANFRVSKNRWVYFDLKDEEATVRFFGTVYNLPGPLEDGMLLKVRGQPRLHNVYGFSVNVASIQPAGEGSIRKAADLLRIQLAKEGLFDEARKRSIDYPPKRIALVTSKQSAAYADFIKILQARWRGLDISLIDVQVQGDIASSQIVAAIEQFNAESDLADVLVLIRGGGSAEDLAAFSTEQVTRAVAASRIPTLVAIGHEIDLSLAEMASDQRASTPSNAAELLVPDRKDVVRELHSIRASLSYLGSQQISLARNQLAGQLDALSQVTEHLITQQKTSIDTYLQLLNALNPLSILRRGYGIIRHNGAIIKSNNLKAGDMIEAELASFVLSASVVKTNSRKRIHHA